MYEPLIEVDGDGEPVGVLAEEFEIRENTTYTFTLREGVAFHDGTPLDAEAVLWNVDRVLEDDIVTSYYCTAKGE